MDRGLSEEGVVNISDLFLCSEHVSSWTNNLFVDAATFLSVALIHYLYLLSELYELGDFRATDRMRSSV